MSVTTAQIKELREATGAGVLACKKALEDAGGDMQEATSLLRERGLAKAEQRSDREATDGVLELYSHGDGRLGVMVEVNCETDFVARTEAFREFAHEIALQIAGASPRWIKPEDVPAELVAEEEAAIRKKAVEEGKPEHVVDQIVAGRMEKFYEQHCLLSQPYIRDDSMTVQKLLQENVLATGENIVVRRFERWEVGEPTD
jgi:elongation factor Ts